MRPTILAGNWKMNLSLSEATELARGIRDGYKSDSKKEAWVFPSHLHIPGVSEILSGTNVKVGLQNIYPSALTAMTGEISPDQGEDFGIKLALVGHSERRQFLGETNAVCREKVHFLLTKGWTVVYCIGEKIEEREAGKTFDILSSQIKEGLKDISSDLMTKLVLAYEPVWAIGTGKTATPEIAQEAHAFIRKEISQLFVGGDKIADAMPILYGGSVKPDNVKSLLDQKDIDGGLVGGASQKVSSYLGLF
ncbi:triose-phosphate isomerase [Leptospira sp. GIMC2001]|uniref:triose-phosphate isomerase n=1 Tax=Leptospira sp. GIMC2001 TaxID=1513297 RepID=UPI0004A5C542|nr:triose-phosphate isomerase [Leptospira sp. GIMC2001]AID56157.1 triosephosphate isomerase [Leptospira sp. GIMC2001]WCL48297.1 triose-phosphate isomerase [Leptospira sp. GIMC2001]